MGLRETPSPAKRLGDDSSTLAQLFYAGFISEAEYHAGVRYGTIVLDYLQSIDAPMLGRGGGCDDLSDSTCFERKLICSQARHVLRQAAGRRKNDLIHAVDRIAVYGEPPRTEREFADMRGGLRALAGMAPNVIPFAKKWKSEGKYEGENRRAERELVP